MRDGKPEPAGPRHVAHNRTLWDCTQAKAGLVEEAFAVFEEMQRPPQSVQPNREGLNTLLNACARALPPWPAKVTTPSLCVHGQPVDTDSLAVCEVTVGICALMSMLMCRLGRC